MTEKDVVERVTLLEPDRCSMLLVKLKSGITREQEEIIGKNIADALEPLNIRVMTDSTGIVEKYMLVKEIIWTDSKKEHVKNV